MGRHTYFRGERKTSVGVQARAKALGFDVLDPAVSQSFLGVYPFVQTTGATSLVATWSAAVDGIKKRNRAHSAWLTSNLKSSSLYWKVGAPPLKAPGVFYKLS